MAQKIVTVNQKGGVGKSTTAHQIAAYVSSLGYKTLMIDLDGQANLSLAVGMKGKGLPGAYVVLDAEHKAPIKEALHKLTETLYIIPGSNDLYNITLPKIGRYTVLKKALKGIENDFDYIVIDTPPALGDMLLNGLVAADKVIVPAQADLFSLDAIKDLAQTIEEVREELNPGIKVEGILLTRYQPRSILTKEVTELIQDTAAALDTKVFETKIRESVSVREAATMHADIFSYDKNSNGAQDYKAFCEELFA